MKAKERDADAAVNEGKLDGFPHHLASCNAGPVVEGKVNRAKITVNPGKKERKRRSSQRFHYMHRSTARPLRGGKRKKRPRSLGCSARKEGAV